jgi:hypothetical protein
MTLGDLAFSLVAAAFLTWLLTLYLIVGLAARQAWDALIHLCQTATNARNHHGPEVEA